MRMNLKVPLLALAALVALTGMADDIVIENDAQRDYPLLFTWNILVKDGDIRQDIRIVS